MLGNMCRESTLISIHAPPRGATKPASSSNALANHFNSRPSARGDRVRTFVFVAGNISIHAPPRGATDDGTRVLKSYLFQFTPLREGRRDGRARGEADCDYFNSRPSARGDVETDTIVAQWFISIHAPPRGATKTSTGLIIQSKFQFTPLREGRQNIGVKPSVPNFISIHAPPRGATEQRRTRAAMTTISIHAPPRGATREIHQRLGTLPISIHAPPRGATGGIADGRPIRTFQFTPLREGRLIPYLYEELDIDISIHAPPRGATFLCRWHRQGQHISIHAPPRGATAPHGDNCPRRNISIHAPPRGATSALPIVPLYANISIHAPPRGATYLLGNGVELENISIHAPPRGATYVKMGTVYPANISIHAPPRGATKRRGQQPKQSPISIHAPPRGATRDARGQRHVRRYFNSRPSARGDPAERALYRCDGGISIHAPPRGATPFSWAVNCPEGISIHAPPRGATAAVQCGRPRPSHFNSRPSARGDLLRLQKSARSTNFNSRPSARGDLFLVIHGFLHSFQFTPLREGRRRGSPRHSAGGISIHAPPRGAT